MSNDLDQIWFWKNIPITFSQGCSSAYVLKFHYKSKLEQNTYLLHMNAAAI